MSIPSSNSSTQHFLYLMLIINPDCFHLLDTDDFYKTAGSEPVDPSNLNEYYRKKNESNIDMIEMIGAGTHGALEPIKEELKMESEKVTGVRSTR